MKHIIIACGAGLASSSMVRDRIEECLQERGVAVRVSQARLSELSSLENDADLFVTTMRADNAYSVPLIHGSAFLTGINEDVVVDEIVAALEEIK